MWGKIFYFLRMSRATGFFINMLLRVIVEIKVFLILYIIILCAFSFTFYIMAPAGTTIWFFLD